MNPALTACSTSGSGEEAVLMAFTKTSDLEDDPRTALSKELQSSFDSLLPARGMDVTRFLLEAAFAIGGSEADLARVQGVSHSTQSTWKKRGIIPAERLCWFQENLVPAALVSPRPRTRMGWYDIGIPIALAIFDQTDFNPYDRTFASRAEQIEASFEAMYGLVNVGALVSSRARYGRNPSDAWRDVCGYLAQHTLKLARLGTRLIELGAPIPARDRYNNFLWSDGTTTTGLPGM